MNKKNKNKNRSKPVNPAPSAQKLEPVEIVEEAKTELVEDTPVALVKESDSIIATKSETLEPGEENDFPTDTPKKPKRNKGKKKNLEEISIEENKSVSNQDSPSQTVSISDSAVKVSDEIKLETTESKEDIKNVEETISANVRKKKNKKKSQEQQKMEVIAQEIIVPEKLSEGLKKEPSQEIKVPEKLSVDLKKEDIYTPDVFESDTKQLKKKNKKKKHRRDSEKSDKADEAVICTAAFQKLISSTDTEKDTETNVEPSKTCGEREQNISTPVQKETLKDFIENVLLPEELKKTDDEVLEYESIHELKSKKKAKKDKKLQQTHKNTEKNNSKEDQVILQEPTVLSSDGVPASPTAEQIECALGSTPPKPKAKIAKPVEKRERRKGKTEVSQCHEFHDDIILVEVDVKEPIPEKDKISENLCASGTSSDINIQKTDLISKNDQKIENKATGIISDKSSENVTTADLISESIEASIVASNLNLADVNIGIQSNEEVIETSITTHNLPVLKSDKELEVSKEKDDDTSITPETYKTVDKKKKKHPKKIDVTGEKTTENKVLVIPDSESEKEKPPKQKEDESSILSTPGDIEISSFKVDELDGSSDATPDFIHHPLATSQQIIDDNNNITICEITSTDEKSNLHLLVPTEPIIQDSGETPDPIPENPSSSFIITRERSLTNEPEKTDLKSKMMEVNQDMEELRLSIERSLAELTSMERSEQEVVVKEETEATKLVPDTILIPCSAEYDVLKKDQSFSENILGDVTLKGTHDMSEASSHTIDPKTENNNVSTEPENIEDKHVEMLVSAKSNELVHFELKETPPEVPARKDHKSKGKGKRKGKQETQSQQTTSGSATTTIATSDNTIKETKKEKKGQSEQSQSSESNQNKGKQQAMQPENSREDSEQITYDPTSNTVELSFEPIEHFEDALTSSVDDVNKTFEMIANEVNNNNNTDISLQNPQINITAPIEDTETAQPKQNPVSPPKNLLGHPDIPVPSNKTDYKKERNKPPNMRQAKVKIKDAVDIEKMEKTKQSRESQTENKIKTLNNKHSLESFSYMTNDNAQYIYKYSFRKVFLQSLCHVCRKELGPRVPCQFCSLVFYCTQKHKDEDWPQHQSLCFAICTIAHLKDQKHIYADARNITGQNYRLLRMQMIISCEKVLKRKLVPWEQEALLYPRVCADATCREWKQSKLADCGGCGQISYCSEHSAHLPSSHQRWCKSYALYKKLVYHQQTRGRLEPKLPTRLVAAGYSIPGKPNEVLAAMYDEKIDMTDTEYATLTQLATAPLTAAYCHQVAIGSHSNGISKKSSFVVHIVGAELQFEADVLFKWELFFLHLKPDVKELTVVLISPDLNPSNLPLDLLRTFNLCESCKADNRRVLLSFQDKKTYYEYWASDEFFSPDIVCAFNPSIQRSSMYNGKDTWPTTLSCILKLKTPFVVSSYSINELNRDMFRIKECSELSGVGFNTVSEPQCNPFASVRPDRNFITDDEIPLLFKNYCFTVLCGV